MKACRAYFTFTASDGSNANDFTFNINFGEENTGIEKTSNLKSQTSNPSDWFDLSGRRLNGKPTQKGIYVTNGQRMVIR